MDYNRDVQEEKIGSTCWKWVSQLDPPVVISIWDWGNCCEFLFLRFTFSRESAGVVGYILYHTFTVFNLLNSWFFRRPAKFKASFVFRHTAGELVVDYILAGSDATKGGCEIAQPLWKKEKRVYRQWSFCGAPSGTLMLGRWQLEQPDKLIQQQL